jgi:hypothetical protein
MRRFVLIFAGLLLAVPAHAQNPAYADLTGKWDLRMANAYPPNGQGWPTEFTFDVTYQGPGTNANTYGNTTLEDHAFTNSVCVANGGGNYAELDSGVAGAVQVTVKVDSGESYIMVGTLSADKTTISGTAEYVSNGIGCGMADIGQTFTATRYQAATGTYTGPFTPDAGGSEFYATITLTEDSSFNLTGTVTSSTNSCFSNLTVNNNAGASLASGNILIFYGADLNGNVIGFVANSGGSTDGPGDPTMTNVFFTAMAYSGSCSGQTYTDGPFQKVVNKSKRRHHLKELPRTAPKRKR